MHVEARFQIKDALQSGDNQITIRFASAVHYARNKRDELGDLPHANSYPDCEPFAFIRKNASNFGWDWGPALITAGIWKAIRLEAWSVARIKSVRPIVKVANEKVAVVDVEVEIERTESDFKILIDAHAGDSWSSTDLEEHSMPLSLYLREPELWWPIGYGEPILYELAVRLQTLHPTEWITADEFTCKIGLREVELDTTPDDYGAAWTLKVNGKEIWCKGANWIPDDVFLTRANDSARLQTRLKQAADCGMNMMRIWGGGIYESDEFYSICNQMGMLVWQDFPFACAAYPETGEFKALVESEARDNVARLCKHPSLVIWNGCNENIWGFFDWNWQAQLNGRAWGAGYYFEMLPAIVEELSPATPYWPGSPYSGSMEIHPNSDQFGNKHMWDTWNRVNHTMFRSYSPRFASEFGHQAPPNYSTMLRALGSDALTPYSPAMLHHQKAPGGNDKMHARLEEHFAMPTDFGDWLYLTQLMQARAMTTAVEWFRSRSVCRGALFWQLNDCWPVTSWAAIDGDGKPKPLYYAAKQFFAERLLTIQPDGEHLALWAHNDTDEIWHLYAEAGIDRMYDLPVGLLEFHQIIEPRSLAKLGNLDGLRVENKASEFIVAECEAKKAFWFFDIDKNLQYPEPKWTATVDGNTLKIEAHTLLRDFTINADRFGGTSTKNQVTILPGECWEFEIAGVSPEELAKVDFSQRPIVNCANYFGAKQ